MPYTIELIDEKGYILVVRNGELTAAELMRSNNEVLSLAAKQKMGCVLVDVRAVTKMFPASELYHATTSMAVPDTPRPYGALLIRPDQEKEMRFVENVARNWGMPLRLFFSFEAAERWLLEQGRRSADKAGN